MPVDYSKWDALELSDDSDIEVHPNVDKKSFIRAKQNQIHNDRLARQHQIETLKYERIINDGLLARIDALLTALKSHENEAKQRPEGVDQLVFRSLLQSTGKPEDDKPPQPPAGVHVNAEDQPSYSKMMAALIDQVKTAVDKKQGGDRYESFLSEVESHKTKVGDLQKELLQKLGELEKVDAGKITSRDIHYGFDSSSVSKTTPSSSKTTEPELLNPGRPLLDSMKEKVPDPEDDDIDEDDMRATPLGKKFAQIKVGDYRALLQFIGDNPGIVSERQTDGLLGEAFNAQSEGKEELARQCVHQALLIQYCRQLGKDGVGLFFKRITTPGHQAQKLFLDDVNTTYARIRSRTKELAEERKNEGEGVEQIQLHAVDPNTNIYITIPAKDSQDADEQQSRQIFESFPSDMQAALESKDLDTINVALGKLKVPEAEKIVELLSAGGMLNIEEGVLDATTEEGRLEMEAMAHGRATERPLAEKAATGTRTEDPGMD